MTVYLLSEPEIFYRLSNEVGRVPGIYKLHSQSKPGQFEQIKRLLDVDEEGILYIGAAKDLITRAMSLIKSVSAAYGENGYLTTGPHTCGQKMAKSDRFRERFPFERLCLTFENWKPHENDENYDHLTLEGDKFGEYFSRYGEYPPLNG
jgi:hypothetical protein